MPTPALVRPRPRHNPADLLTAYLPGSFFYASPRGCVLADGVHARVPADRPERAEAVSEALAGAAEAGVRDPIVVGAVGFAPGSAASLVVPSVVRRAATSEDGGWPPSVFPASYRGTWSVSHRPAPERYMDAVRRALRLIEAGELSKVVLARCLELTAAVPVAVPSLLAQLVRTDPDAHVFAADVTAPGDPATRTVLGASPELLVSRRGREVTANPLAGSAARAHEPAEDRRRIAALRASDKDRREHALVSAHVAEVLGRFCTDVRVPSEPEVTGTATMWHLSSPITGRLVDPAVSSLALAEALHPTPAVGGVPPSRAHAAIAALEAEARGYYAGLVGWSSLDGDGEWALTIRAAEVCDRTVTLFAGAGVVAGSQPEAELAETSAKFRTMLRAIEVEEAL
ncbi:isochorismate synthase [Pseudonocardia acaciae]|uniref:isochorismate synthase n=1 Tax=Pseudonocardia acaciae TaxID=551276 RepID=UPI00048EFA08|nr:isochorismate synthase [Pseudonocardia acaciae]